MNVLISIGELVDKLSILEIKQRKILSQIKLIEIEKEIHEIGNNPEINTVYSHFYYSILVYINERIWDSTDEIKCLNYKNFPTEFAKLSNEIFELNQKRFRIKNIFNLIYSSSICEQKSYSVSYCKIIVNSKELLYNNINTINYLSIEYDYIIFEGDVNGIENIFTTPNFIWNNKIVIRSYNDFNWEFYIKYYKDLIDAGINNESLALEHWNHHGKNEKRYGNIIIQDIPENILINNTIILQNIHMDIPENILRIFEFKPLNYKSGGRLGDFIHGLGVIYEYFLLYGRKGNLFISNDSNNIDNPDVGDSFSCGRKNTYNDTYSTIIDQEYINEYSLFLDQRIDINLNKWRYNIAGKTFFDIYKRTYNIDWGRKKWLFCKKDSMYSDKVIINTTNYRFPSIDFQNLYREYSKLLIFISPDEKQYSYFKNTTGLEIEYYKPVNFEDMCTIINSCKLFIGSYSAPYAIAVSLDVPRIPENYFRF